MARISVTVDGIRYADDVPPRTLLVYYLRDLGKVGTVVGCDTSNCGACTVLMTDPDGRARAVKSCNVLAVQADGREVTTVEGLSDGNGGLHPIQAAFKQEHGLQCGFCTPGMMVCASALLARDSDPDEETIRWELSGNLCRCTGYMNIVKAVKAAAEQVRAAADAPGTTS